VTAETGVIARKNSPSVRKGRLLIGSRSVMATPGHTARTDVGVGAEDRMADSRIVRRVSSAGFDS